MLVIYAHPNKDGHCGLMLKILEEKLKLENTDYEVLDLYTMGYDPVLGQNEHYTSGHREISSENRRIQDKIKAADKMVFIFPLWWQSPPAILKGFFDRVLTARFAFVYEKMMPKGLLAGKAAVLASMGSPRWLEWLYFRDRCFKVVSKDILGFCGIKARVFAVDNANRLSERQKKKCEKQVNKALKYLK